MTEDLSAFADARVSTGRPLYHRWMRWAAFSIGSVFLWTVVLSAPADAWAQTPQKPPLPKYHAPVPLKPLDDPAWHTIDYHKTETARPGGDQAHRQILATRLTLLDEVGRLQRGVSAAETAEWKQQLHYSPLASSQAALLHIHLGETLLTRDEQPESAHWHFRQAKELAKHSRELRGLASYDDAIAAYYEGAYEEAQQGFKRLLTNHSGLSGFDRRTATLFWRHAQACAGYHVERAKLGIPEPPRLDPLCGASAVASSLKAAGMAFDKKRVLANMRVTGRGSNMQDVLTGASKLGLSGHLVAASDKALMALPKPLVAYVEHDHFVSVLAADKGGVNYLCADCGPWPGGNIRLTWAQWHKMEATTFAALVKPGSDVDGALALLSPPNEQRRSGIQIASAGSRFSMGVSGRLRLLKLYNQLGITQPMGGQVLNCGSTPTGQQCQCQTQCPNDQIPKGVTPLPGSGPGASNPAAPGGSGGGMPGGSGPSEGITVNSANGELGLDFGPDLTVYNPIGPSVGWGVTYQSLRGYYGMIGYEDVDFGTGFSHPYNVGVVANNSYPTQVYLVESNGARVSLSASQAPSATTPHVICTVQAGVPMLAEWDYNSATGGTYFILTQPDRSQWLMQTVSGSGGGIGSASRIHTNGGTSPSLWYPLIQIKDEVGNPVNFNYSNSGGLFPLLASITDKNGASLLTITRDGNNAVSQVSDRYGRSVYYHVGTYNTAGVPPNYPQSQQGLDHISQVVATGTTNPPDRHVFGYANVGNGEGAETIPMLHTVTAPSPTGTGTQTATINYLPGPCTVLNVVDANGNTHAYNQVDANHTQVQITDANNNLVYSYTAGYDMNMSVTSVTNGATDANGNNTQIIASLTFADANDPFRPSQILDGVGNANGGAGGKGTTEKTWDQFGNCLTMTSARGTTTTLAYNYQNFAMGEMTSVQEGAKTPTAFTYYEPSGLIHTMTRTAPGSSGNTNQTVVYSYTYDALGNMLTATGPGNNATQTETTTLGYTQDGTYSQTEALNQPLTKTDSLGHVRHFRYDALGRDIARIDSVGNETDTTYNAVGQGTSVMFPATGETGTGRAQVVNTFLYPGGPQTSLTQYNEAGAQVFQEQTTYGKEGEMLTRTGSTQPVAQAYDALYRLKTLTDGNNHSTQYSYGTSGYLSQVSYPNGDTLQVTSYDLNGNPLSRTDGRGVVTNLVYNDVESRLTDIQYPATPSLNVHVTYDGYGRKNSITDGSGSQSVTFDDLSAPTFVTTTYTGLAAQTISYGYYPDGSRQTVGLPDGSLYTNTYDAAGRHVGLAAPGGHSFSWAYADNNWLTSQTSDNTIVTTPTRDAHGLVTELNNSRTGMMHTLLSDFSLTLASNMTPGSMTSTISGVAAFSGTTTYAHDTKIELTSEQSNRDGGYNNQFGYDGSGNPTTFKGVTQTFNSANQNTASGYDGNGNPTSYKGSVLAFDVENRLTAYGNVLTAGYRGDGQRAWKQTSAGLIYFFYDGDHLLYETNATGTITGKNMWSDTVLLARSNPTRTLLYTWDPQGNVCQQLDASTGSVVESYLFDAFGTRATSGSDIAAMNDPYAGFGGAHGYYQDAETGLSLLGHRYFDPSTGRFLTRDPIHYQGGINLYEYVGNGPLGGHDRSGLMGWGEFMECLNSFEMAAECLGALAKLAVLWAMGSLGDGTARLCQSLAACAADGVFSCICEALLAGPLAEFPILIGCICGAITSGIHYALDFVCSKLLSCEKTDWNWTCFFLNVFAGAFAGCIGGWLPKEWADELRRILMGLLNGIVDGGMDALCAKAGM